VREGDLDPDLVGLLMGLLEDEVHHLPDLGPGGATVATHD